MVEYDTGAVVAILALAWGVGEIVGQAPGVVAGSALVMIAVGVWEEYKNA